MDHILFLSFALAALILGSLPKLKFTPTLAIGLIIADFIIHFKVVNQDTLLHFSVDLIIISVLATFAQLLNKNWIKLIYLPVAIYILSAIHPLNKTKSIEKELAINAFQNLEILAQLDPNINIKEWVAHTKNQFDITYPLFNPKDKSGLLDEYVGININKNSNPESIRRLLDNDKSVVYYEFNEILELKLPTRNASNDQIDKQNSNDPLSKNQWANDKLELDKLHQLINSKNNVNQSASQILIAILDTGIEAEHEDLQENYISTQKAYDRDVRGHGTHCAGIAAAVTGNNIGIASLLPPNSNIKVTSIKVLSNFGIGAQHQIIAGIIEASDMGADVISMSLGAPSIPGKENVYNEAVSYARRQGAIVVVSAGNSNEDASKFSPANCQGVITVASVDKNFNKSTFSNTIENISLGIHAPGQDIYSTTKGNSYINMSGTSMASPFVAGLIALLKSIDPKITTEEAYAILKKSSTRNNGLEIINPIGALSEMIDI